MFSGLTNQVSSWIGKKQEEEVPKTEDASAYKDLSENTSDKISPVKATRLEMLGNVKNHMSSWLGGNIPGLRRTSESNSTVIPEISAADESTKDQPIKEQDEEDSSATGGADSEANVSDEGEEDLKDDNTPAAAVSTKALLGAKNLGSFLYSAVNKAGKSVSEAGAKIKKTVGENSILGEFNKEQETFIKEKEGKVTGVTLPPWVGYTNEESLKEECLALSTDRKNFIRSPPPGVEFNFDYEVSYPIAMAALAEDPNLDKMRFELVPKMVKEEQFWRNYFYRVSLICQANELSSMAKEGEHLSTMNRQSKDKTNAKEHDSNQLIDNNLSVDNNLNESPKITTTTTSSENEDEWEKELEAELQGYEMVSDGDRNNGNLEQQLQELADLK